MEINPKVLWKQKEEELKKEGIKNPVLDRTIDSYFKYLVKDTVLDKIAKSIVKRFFDEDIENVSEALSPEFQVAYNQRDFKLDVVCQADDIFLGLDMQKSAYVVERFFIYWATMANNKEKGEPTDKLVTAKCLQVVLSRNSLKDKDSWAVCWQTVPRNFLTGEIIGKPNPYGINVLEIDLDKFQKMVKTPDSDCYLEWFLAFINSRTSSETAQIYDADKRGILNDIVKRDTKYLNVNWERFMDICKDIQIAEAKAKKAEAEAEKAKVEARANAEALQKAEADAKAEAEARQKAEADKAKAEAESKAKDAEIERLKAELAKAQAKAQS